MYFLSCLQHYAGDVTGRPFALGRSFFLFPQRHLYLEFSSSPSFSCTECLSHSTLCLFSSCTVAASADISCFCFCFCFYDFHFNCLRCGEILAWLRWCFSKTVNSKQESQLISNPNTILHAHIYKPPGEQALLCSHSAHDAPCVHIFIVFTVA